MTHKLPLNIQRLSPITKNLLWSIYIPVAKIWFHGSKFYCPICGGNVRKFLTQGIIPREHVMCPVCKSLERHRLTWLFLQRRTNLFNDANKKMLHVAPERMFEYKFKQVRNLRYITADLYDPRVMVKMDITNIELPDNSFDVIYCSHVFEHISDDRKAMSELYRILKPNGWAVLLVPITTDSTFEDPTITDPQKREELFGQHDHVRRYGPDYVDRLGDAGFTVTAFSADELTTQDEQQSMMLLDGQKIYYCTK